MWCCFRSGLSSEKKRRPDNYLNLVNEHGMGRYQDGNARIYLAQRSLGLIRFHWVLHSSDLQTTLRIFGIGRAGEDVHVGSDSHFMNTRSWQEIDAMEINIVALRKLIDGMANV